MGGSSQPLGVISPIYVVLAGEALSYLSLNWVHGYVVIQRPYL